MQRIPHPDGESYIEIDGCVTADVEHVKLFLAEYLELCKRTGCFIAASGGDAVAIYEPNEAKDGDPWLIVEATAARHETSAKRLLEGMAPAGRNEAIANLLTALEQFLDSGQRSDADDVNELEVEAVNRGGYVHNAVCAVQPFYGGKLPVGGDAWLAWRNLLQTCRHEQNPRKRQHDAEIYADVMRKWAKGQLGSRRPPEPLLPQAEGQG